jgi:hypothetical protein
MTHEPAAATSAHFPPEYGSIDPADLTPWSYVEDRLRSALN